MKISSERWRRTASLPGRTSLSQASRLLIVKLTARDRIDRERQNVVSSIVGRSHPVPIRRRCKTQANRALVEDDDRGTVEIECFLISILDVGQVPGIAGMAQPAGSCLIAIAQLIQLVPGPISGHIFVFVQMAVLCRFANAEDKAFEARDGTVHDIYLVGSLDLSMAGVFHGVAVSVSKTNATVHATVRVVAGTDTGSDTKLFVIFGLHWNLVGGQNAAC